MLTRVMALIGTIEPLHGRVDREPPVPTYTLLIGLDSPEPLEQFRAAPHRKTVLPETPLLPLSVPARKLRPAPAISQP